MTRWGVQDSDPQLSPAPAELAAVRRCPVSRDKGILIVYHNCATSARGKQIHSAKLHNVPVSNILSVCFPFPELNENNKHGSLFQSSVLRCADAMRMSICWKVAAVSAETWLSSPSRHYPPPPHAASCCSLHPRKSCLITAINYKLRADFNFLQQEIAFQELIPET